MNIKPLGERVVIKQTASEEVTASGIVLPDTAKEKPQQGKVLAVGPGKLLDNGNRAPVDVQVGDIVLFAKYAGSEFKYENEDYMILNSERDILAVLS